MSQKYKSFTKGVAENYVEPPPGVKRIGYLRKLKKMKKRFFVLHSECETTQARLEYYSSEKKWRSGGEPRRCIELKSCFNIGRKLHSKQKFVIALYTEDDCFSIVTDTLEELELWLNDILEEHHASVDEDSKGKPIYEHVWQVNIDDNDLEFSRNITGPYRIALSPKSLTLIKMSPSTEKVDILEFPLMSIRRCGHSGKHFFIELGRSAVTGAGGMWMETEATIVAQNMHETVLGAMKSSRSKEEAVTTPRPRSASTSENSKAVPARRPIGIVMPQTSLSSNSILSNSRERCDSLPTRAQTISSNLNTSFNGTPSSTHASNEPTIQKLCSRPHSMYEWPSFNSPSTKNLSFTPGSLSNACTNNASSYEDIANTQPNLHPICYPQSNEKVLSSKKSISEVPDEYLIMSPTEENKPVNIDYMSMNPTPKKTDVKSVLHTDINIEARKENLNTTKNYIDMGPSPSLTAEVKADGYIPMVPCCTVENTSVLIKEGYLDMSSISEPLPKYVQKDSDNFAENERDYVLGAETSKVENMVLDKIPSLLVQAEKENCNQEMSTHVQVVRPVRQRNSESGNFFSTESMHHKNREITDRKIYKSNSSKDVLSSNNISNMAVPNKSLLQKFNSSNSPRASELAKKPFTFDRNTEKQGPHINTRPTLPLCKVDNNTKTHSNTFSSTFSDPIKKVSFSKTSECVQVEENVERDDQHELVNFAPGKATSSKILKVSPIDQNTNFSCLLHNENSNKANFICAPICSVVNKVSNSVKKTPLNRTAQIASDVPLQKSIKSATRFSHSEVSSNVKENHNDTSSSRDKCLPNFSIKSIPESNKTESHLIAAKTTPHGDYVNLNFGDPVSKQVSIPSQSSKPPPPPTPVLDDVNYTNCHFGKPYCPLPNPTVATIDSHELLSSPQISLCVDNTISSVNHPTAKVPSPKVVCPHTLPAFRKQMSAPAVPSTLKVDLPSPGRKSSCPVTASVSMIKPPLPISSHSTRSVPLQPLGTMTGHLRVSTSRSPDHSSVSSISSASDEMSSSHSSPKTLSTSTLNRQTATDCVYENIAIPQRASNSRPPSVSSEKELNYASLDLAPASKTEIPRSPITCKPSKVVNDSELSMYAEIDFTKSEGLKNTSGTLREAAASSHNGIIGKEIISLW